jgi:membrane associated rhomboid family serine protease
MGFALVPEELVTCHDLVGPQQAEVKVERQQRYDRHGRVTERYGTEWITIDHSHGPFPIFLTLLTSMFLHGDIIHLICNMWFLAVFGRAVEYALLPGRFLTYYVICGVAGGIAYVLADPHSIIPCVGASGAISGVMGAYLAIHPMRKVKMWVGIYWGVIEVPAVVVLGIWFLLQYAAAGAALEAGLHTGTAYMAHVGGFVAGLALIWGTILYYQFKQARMPPEEDTHTQPASESRADGPRLEDAFRMAPPRSNDRVPMP